MGSFVILVSGLPAAGKSTLAARVASDLGVPLLRRDALKKAVFGPLGQLQEVRSLIPPAMDRLMVAALELVVSNGGGAVVDNNFNVDQHASSIRDVIERLGLRAAEVSLWGDPAVLRRRFIERADPLLTDELASFLDTLYARTPCSVLAAPHHVERIDTTDLPVVDGAYPELLARLANAVGAERQPASRDIIGGPAGLPRKRVGAGVLLRNTEGDVLLVEPVYKELWEIPGGIVEDNESPREAAHRECWEELGIGPEIGELLCVHYTEGARTPSDGIMFVFDAGRTATQEASFVLPADELRSAQFVAIDDLGRYLPAAMARRIAAAAQAADKGCVAYLER